MWKDKRFAVSLLALTTGHVTGCAVEDTVPPPLVVRDAAGGNGGAGGKAGSASLGRSVDLERRQRKRGQHGRGKCHRRRRKRGERRRGQRRKGWIGRQRRIDRRSRRRRRPRGRRRWNRGRQRGCGDRWEIRLGGSRCGGRCRATRRVRRARRSMPGRVGCSTLRARAEELRQLRRSRQLRRVPQGARVRHLPRRGSRVRRERNAERLPGNRSGEPGARGHRPLEQPHEPAFLRRGRRHEGLRQRRHDEMVRAGQCDADDRVRLRRNERLRDHVLYDHGGQRRRGSRSGELAPRRVERREPLDLDHRRHAHEPKVRRAGARPTSIRSRTRRGTSSTASW